MSGCFGSDGTGTFSLFVKDAEDDIGDFSALEVTVTRIELTSKDGAKSNQTPSKSRFDLTRLTGANATTLFAGKVAVGNYSRLDLVMENATGTLAAGGTTKVEAPSGRLFVNSPFEIAEGKETIFVFDIQVHLEGKDKYAFKPNAGESGPRKEKPAKVV